MHHCLLTFVDPRQLLISVSICIPESGQKIRNAGVYALVHSSFSEVITRKRYSTNAMIRRFTVTQQNNSKMPKLYLVGLETIDAPTIGIPDIGWSVLMQIEPQYLLLFRRRVLDWLTSWDTMIDECCGIVKHTRNHH